MIYESYLYHHGIKGQKWGKRNGPPYPLDSGNGKKKYGMSKSQVKSSIRKAKADYRKNEDPKHTFTGATGKNYEKTRNEYERTIRSDEKIKNLKNERDKAYSNALKAAKSYNIESENKWQDIGDKAQEKLDKRQKDIGKSFTNKYYDAILKDIGYNDMKRGRDMLNEYGIKVADLKKYKYVHV